jgi:hypothetical protein
MSRFGKAGAGYKAENASQQKVQLISAWLAAIKPGMAAKTSFFIR